MSNIKNYTCAWETDAEATNPMEAAKLAEKQYRDSAPYSGVWTVIDSEGNKTYCDLCDTE